MALTPARLAQVVRPAEGGIRRHVSLLLEGLDRSKFQSTLFAPNEFTLEDQVSEVSQVPVDIAARTNVRRDLRSIRALATTLNGRFDLLHAHGLRAALIGVLAARRTGIPALFTAHNLPPVLNLVQRVALVFVSRRSDGIIAVSNAVSRNLQQCGVSASRIHVIPNGIRLDDFIGVSAIECSPLGITTSGPVLAFVGRLSPEKGVDTLLDAFELVVSQKPDSHLILIGSGPEEARLKLRAQKMPGVHFLGRRTDVAQLLLSSDLVVVPSYTEGQGIVAIEAMASGRPVIATDVGGLAETVIQGETGILALHHDSRAFADAILALLNDPQRAASMGAAGKERAAREYSVTRMVDSVQQLYSDICNRRAM